MKYLRVPWEKKHIYTCDKCKRVFTSSEVLTAHKKRHRRDPTEKRHQCSLCPYATNYSSHLRQHSFTHSGERPFKCKLCDAGFVRNPLLQKHMLSHKQDEDSAKYCQGKKATVVKENPMKNEKGSKNLNSVDEKKQQKPSTPETSVKSCTKCSKTFDEDDLLQKHMRMHRRKEKPHKCKVCRKRFTASSNLKRHEKKHSKEVLSKNVTKEPKNTPSMSLKDTEKSPMDCESPLLLKDDVIPTGKPVTNSTELKSLKKRKAKKQDKSKRKKVSSNAKKKLCGKWVVYESRQKEHRAQLLSHCEEIASPRNPSESSSDTNKIQEKNKKSLNDRISPVDGEKAKTKKALANDTHIEEADESSSDSDARSSEASTTTQSKNKLSSPDKILDMKLDSLQENNEKTAHTSSED